MDQSRTLIKRSEKLIREGFLEKASRSLSEVIDVLEARGDSVKGKKLLSDALILSAYCWSRMGEFTKAVQDARRAMEISIGIKDTEGEAEALMRIGYVHWQKSDYPMALEFFNSSLEKAVLCGADHLAAKVKVEIGNVYSYLKDFKKAERVYLDAVKIMKSKKDIKELARIYNNLGACYLNSKRYDEAIEVLKKCADCGKRIGDQMIQGWANFNIAEGLLKSGKSKDALAHLDKAVALLRRVGDRIGIAAVHLNYGQAYAALGDWDRARDHFNRGLRIERKLDMPASEGEALTAMGKMYLDKGDNDVAIGYLEKALKVYKDADLKEETNEVAKMIQRSTAKPR